MSGDRFARVSELFLAACRKPPGEREAYLDEACGSDADLRREVDRMLAADEAVPAHFEDDALPDHAARRVAAAFANTRDLVGGAGVERGAHERIAVSAPPATVGRYRIIREIASGGMGTVYEAEQEQPRRRVALKLIRATAHSEAAQRRFEREIEILGRLRHPGIAQIYEAGSYGAGSHAAPYFAMEYIAEALTLGEYATAHGLDLAARLELFAKVCDAIDSGHERGIVHRDLKPGNVLVDADGQPKVIDFGVAHVTDPDLTADSLRTDVGQLVGTVQYMSPEQCAADPDRIDARTDVYALGVVLYQLVSDELPYDLRNMPLHEATRVIQEEEATSLSSRDHALRGDVETIVGKALAKDPARRYQTAAAMAADVRRHLAGAPIAARADSTLYVLRRRLRPHRRALAAAILFLLVLVTAATIVTRVNRDRQRLREEVAKITGLLDTEEAESDLAAMKMLGEISSILLEADRRTDDFSAEFVGPQELNDIETWLRRAPLEPADEASLRTVIGRGWLKLEMWDRALPHLERARTLRMVYGAAPVDLAESVHNLARAHVNLYRLESAEALYRDALRRRADLFGPMNLDVAESRNGLAGCLKRAGRYRAAEVEYRDALDVRGELLPSTDEHIAASINNLATCLEAQGRFDEAIPLFENVQRRTSGTEPNPLYRARLRRHIALCALYTGAADATIRNELATAVEELRAVPSDEHAEIASAHHDLALCEAFEERWDEAAKRAEAAADIRGRVLRAPHPDLAASEVLFAEIAIARGEDDVAAAHLDAAEGQYDRLFDDDHPALARAHFLRARIHHDRGHADGARRWCEEALRIQRAKLSIGHPHLQQSLALLARIEREAGDAGAAESTLHPCVKAVSDGAWIDPRVRVEIGLTAVQRGDREAGAAVIRDALAELQARWGEMHPATRAARDALSGLGPA